MPQELELMGLAEVARLLKVSRPRVSHLMLTEGFPAPVAHLACGPIWQAGDIRMYADIPRTPGRPKRPRTDDGV